MTTPSDAVAQESVHHSGRRALAIARRVPATLTIIAIMLVVGVTTQALWNSATDSGLTDRWGFGLTAFEDGDLVNVVVGAFIAPEPWMYGLIIAVLAVGAGYLELHYGAVRMILVIIGTHVAAVTLVALMFWALTGVDAEWVRELSQVRDVGLSNAGFGALGAMTAGMPVLWRRRTRLIVSLYCVAMILYAAEIWDFTHATAFFVGLAIGPWVVRRGYEFGSMRFGVQESRDLTAILVAFGALHPLLTRIWPGEGGILSFGEADDAAGLSLLGIVGIASVSLLLSYALHKGRRGAWVVTLILQILDTLLSVGTLTNANQVFDFALGLALLVMLLVWRRRFSVRATPGGRAVIWRRAGLTAIGIVIFTTVSILALRNSFDPVPTLGQAIGESIIRIFGLGGAIEPTTTAASALLSSIGFLWFIAVATTIAALLLGANRPGTTESDRDTFIGLQTSTDTMTSIGYMARWRGIDHWVSDDRAAALGYKQVGNTVIVLSDIAGRADAVAAAVPEFEDFCRSRGWRLAYFAASPALRAILEASDYRSIQVAEDTVIRLPELAFTGKAWQDVRSAINRAGREDVTMRAVRFHDAPRGLKDQLEAISAQWVGDKSLPEMGFTLGDLPEAADPNVLLHLAVDSDGTVHGMTSWMPVYRDGDVVGWTIDIMKRRLDDGVMSGVMEFLIAQSAMTFKEQGYEFISLSCAPLSYSTAADGPVERLLDTLADKMEPYYGFTSLEKFKAKFKPEHIPMYLCFTDDTQLPAITLAILRAYLPDAGPADFVRAAVHPG